MPLISTALINAIGLENGLILLAFAGMVVVVYQLIRIRVYIGWGRGGNLGAILADSTLAGFGWLGTLAGLSLMRQAGYINDPLRDALMIIILLFLISIISMMIYRLHQWHKHILHQREK